MVAPLVALCCALVACMLGLQGCEPIGHPGALWENKPSYITNYQFVPFGRPLKEAVLNTCEIAGLPAHLVCSGNGRCKEWRTGSNASNPNPIRFCECQRDYSDPECKTRRKSQTTAYMLSLFGGYLGLDRFYLGEYHYGIAKLASLGGVGVWWLVDIVRIGSAPVYAGEFRVAADLPHWSYVAFTTGFFGLLGHLVFGIQGSIQRRRKALKKMTLDAEEEFFRLRGAAGGLDAEPDREGPLGALRAPPATGGYGALGGMTDQEFAEAVRPAPPGARGRNARQEEDEGLRAAPLTHPGALRFSGLRGQLGRFV